MASHATAPSVRLIVGLGNPGPEYVSTYHNAGYLALDYLLIRRGMRKHVKRERLFDYGRSGPIILVRPRAFMNDSGRAVRAACRKFRIPPHELLVIHDESDLPLGSSKVSFGRGPAGHRGVQSVIDALGTKQFFRLRIGIRTRRGKAGSYVLAPIRPEEREMLYSVFAAAFGNANLNVITNENP